MVKIGGGYDKKISHMAIFNLLEKITKVKVINHIRLKTIGVKERYRCSNRYVTSGSNNSS